MKKIIFNKIKFVNIDEFEFKKIIKKKGVFVFPAAPPLATLKTNSNYHKSLLSADFVFFDSGFFVLLLRFFKNIKVNKFSGYKFLGMLLDHLKKQKKVKLLSIDPSQKDLKINKKYLINQSIGKIYNYIAPKYYLKKLADKKLINKIKKIKPHIILINLGGGTQEILGNYIKKKINYKGKIICTGAAISFFTKNDAPINKIIDENYMGWLLRLFFNPLIFFKRLFKALNLIKVVYNCNIKLL